ncbi:MAG: osmoprotectant transport system permease protein [Thermosipho sp. (in: thermotogales)]|nr:osmoprotectant transport system permease protein [Geotoga sp.]MDN5324742.1 osmoprotectant transport system permease protein [Thermosipho sp. (in: thermotogales)]
MAFFEYLIKNNQLVLSQLIQHLKIVAIAIPLAIVIAVPIGIYISHHKKIANVVIYISSVLMTIPSLALFGIMVVLLAPFNAGIGIVPAIIAIILYSLLPMIRNTLVAIKTVNPAMIEAAKGMGMTSRQILFKVRLPLALPIIMAGVRNAAVMGVGVTTIAYLIGAGGLGYFIFGGLSRSRLSMILLGAILVSALGIAVNYGLLALENALTSEGLKIERKINR